MKRLTLEEVEKFASRRGVRRVAVENFSMSMGENEKEARSNLILDSFLYSWNSATIKAVRDGIEYACKANQRANVAKHVIEV